MTDTTTSAVRQFAAAMPTHLSQHLNITQAVDGYVNAAMREHGWTIPQLVAECSRDMDDYFKPGGLITSRLKGCASHPPAGKTKAKALPSFCTPDCRDRNGILEDPKTRLPIGKCECRSAT